MLPELQKSPLHIHSGLFCVFPRISIFYAMFRSRFFYCLLGMEAGVLAKLYQ